MVPLRLLSLDEPKEDGGTVTLEGYVLSEKEKEKKEKKDSFSMSYRRSDLDLHELLRARIAALSPKCVLYFKLLVLFTSGV